MNSKQKLKEAMTEWLGSTIEEAFQDQAYIVLHTYILKNMDEDFQKRFVGMIQEIEDTFDLSDMPKSYQVSARGTSKKGKKGTFIEDKFASKRPPKLKRK